MSGASTSQSPPSIASISDVNTLFQNAKKYEELNVIGTGKKKSYTINNLNLHVPVIVKSFRANLVEINYISLFIYLFWDLRNWYYSFHRSSLIYLIKSNSFDEIFAIPV